MQRGGTPTAFDRVLSTKYGAKAMELALEGKINVLTVIKDGKLDSVPLEDVVGNNKEISKRFIFKRNKCNRCTKNNR